VNFRADLCPFDVPQKVWREWAIRRNIKLTVESTFLWVHSLNPSV
jgi:hypothetical protein